MLDDLAVEPEYGGLGYERADFEHDRGYLCDSAGTDPYTGIAFDPSTCDVDHIVAAKEAFESGAWEWDAARRRSFGNDALNLVATRDCVNRSKGAGDPGEWTGGVGSGACEGVTITGKGWCYLAWKTIEVKAAYGLSVDERERDVLSFVLGGCPESGPVPPSDPFKLSFASPPEPTKRPDEEAISPAGPTGANDECHPAYSPCLPNLPGDALNCGNLAAGQKPVTVHRPGVDPYRLDGDGDGIGCESSSIAERPTPRPVQQPAVTCTHDGRGHGYLGYNPGTHTHPFAGHGPHQSGKCAGV
ncbi:excalibur calcium-binding domain-containing protein [Candidatus Poriferisocius sp.]|uniref:excalibur calcium-binding domain-containing protein n=1 Tax=Candidatus Poriferisocius sp. TaxID=3101276 RepID=UPI003B025757